MFSSCSYLIRSKTCEENLGSKLSGAEKAARLHLYEKAVFAPTIEIVNDIRSEYTVARKILWDNSFPPWVG